MKDQSDREKRIEQFKARQMNALTNVEKNKKLQLDTKLERDKEKEKYSPMKSITPANAASSVNGDMMSETMYSTLKQPLYNDIFNDIFTAKRHQAYNRRERNDKRTAYIGEKFKDVWAVGNAEMDRRIKEDFEKRQKEHNEFLEERQQKRKSLIMQTKEFQTKQIKDKRVLENSDKKKERDEFKKEQERQKALEVAEKQTIQKKKEKFFENK